MQYSQERIEFKHYGKYVARMLNKLGSEQNKEARDNAVDSLARYMRSKSFEYNQDHPNNEVIIKDIKNMINILSLLLVEVLFYIIFVIIIKKQYLID